MKTLVMVMGVLILLATGVLVHALMTRQGADGRPARPASVPDGAFGTVGIDVPAGAEVTVGGISDSRLALHAWAAGPGGADHRIHVIDLTTGKRLGEIRIEYGD